MGLIRTTAKGKVIGNYKGEGPYGEFLRKKSKGATDKVADATVGKFRMDTLRQKAYNRSYAGKSIKKDIKEFISRKK
jgi:hypothetical protein